MYEGERVDIRQWAQKAVAEDEGLVTLWEQAVAAYIGVPHTAAVSSGRGAMTLIFEHLGLGAGDEVIVPAYTLGELLPLIEGFNAKAVPADIDPETLNLDPGGVERRITPRTKAILALHAFGVPCAVEAIVALADRHGIPVIEDCAHSLGATVSGRATGAFGYAAFFSFETTKPVNTFGGGMVASQDKALIDAIHQKTAAFPYDLDLAKKKMRANRTEQRLFSTGLAFPLLYLLATPSLRGLMNRLYRGAQHLPCGQARYSPVQAKLGVAKLATLDQRIRVRKERAELYRSLLKPGLRIQRIGEDREATWYFLVAILPRPAVAIRKRLLFRGIDAGIEEEIADNCAELLGYTDCPNIADVYPRAIDLPMFDGISQSTVERVTHALNALV